MAWYRCVGGAGGSLKLRTASGAIATFNTNIVDAFKSLKSNINPVQDLHGYSKPWSGGGGKNKFSNVWSDYTKPNDYRICPITLTNGQTYKLSATLKGTTMTDRIVVAIVKDGTQYSNFVGFTQLINANGEINTLSSFTIDNTWVNPKLAIYCSDEAQFNRIFANYNIQLEQGSTATAYEPYSNICPISGFNALSVTRTGKNRLNYDAWKTVAISKGTAVWENNGVKITATGNDAYTNFTITSFPIAARVPITEGETITLSWEESTNKNGLIVIFPNGTTTGMVTVNNGAVKKATYTATSGITFVTFRFGVANSGDTIAYKNIQIEKGSTATDFEPYNGQTATVNFGQTVYGGVVDVTNGKVTVTHGIVDLGDLTWSAAGNMWFASLSGVKPIYDTTVPDAICSNYKAVSWVSGTTGTEEGVFCFLPAYNQLRIRDTSYSSASDFQTAMSGVQLVYELATPIEITTTPETLTAIVGQQNNVFSDTNGDMEVKYLYRE